MKILLIGASGQLAQDIHASFATENKHDEIVPVTHDKLDIRDAAGVNKLVVASRPDWVINTAAFHKVDLCEVEPEATFAVNEAGVRNLAHAAEESGARMLQFSSDYVFDGRKKTPYMETEEPNPISVYGKSRFAGEEAVQQLCGRFLIIRTCGLY